MQHKRQRLFQWMILAIAMAIPVAVGVPALLRLREPSDLTSGVGNGLVVLLCALVLVLLAAVFLSLGCANGVGEVLHNPALHRIAREALQEHT